MIADERPPIAPRRGAAWRRWLPAVGVFTWTAAVAYGFSTLFAYANEPGAPSSPPQRWPSPRDVALAADRPTLLLFAHPRCPCTRATIAELDRLMAANGDALDATVAFYADAALGDGWARAELWEHAARIPGVRVVEDPDGALASTFAAQTSGAVVVYAPDGRLRFAGGLTASRGHEGDSAGTAAIAELAANGACATCSTPVFGCELGERAEEATR